MDNSQPPRSVSSSTWTGPPPEPRSGPDRVFRPRPDPAEQHRLRVAGVLLVICFVGFFGWYAVLGSRSPVVPSPETGRTVALDLFSRREPRPIYVRPAQAVITYLLLVAAFAVPVAYILRSEARSRRSKR